MATIRESGLEALKELKTTEPPVFLAPSPISEVVRVALQYLFTKLKPFNPKSPFDELLVDGFDAEQIWQQLDMQSQPLLSSLRQEVKRFAKNPEEIRNLGNLALKVSNGDDLDGMDMGGFDSDDDDDDLEANESEEEEEESEEEEEEQKEEAEEKEEEEVNDGIEDKFFKIKDLEEFLEEGEAEEYGTDRKNKKGVSKGKKQNLSDDEEKDEDDEDEEEDEEFGAFADDDNEEAEKLGKARYADFFGGKKSETKMTLKDVIEDEDAGNGNHGIEKLSTHEKEQLKLQSKIEQMEKANLDPKHWTMQGEITATKRPTNSALEVDLDFEHNARPAPVITEEVTASLEDLIKSRIIEARFDDVQRAPSLPTNSKREVKELDDNKSKKGLAAVYEDEYVQKANPAFAPATFSDELKKEASVLFKKLCLKLDALSHFHFTPKPVIEEMSIQTNVPAIAMEEVAPVAVSDAAMLAPEEIFSGKGNIKDESELTQDERKRRRAKKKRKFKAESANQPVKKARDTTTENPKTVSEER
ncbi:U3 small nucleolar ribonucleoprotein protein MPP10 isoform X2 [Eutrema salsugineum]|uniref:U3 small nucleolar ribonucleoprotein protein MPP10 isoform X2 n=1 Tax=Eutrema salsugineum TaxID=72664 RepID=UPI000CECE733|nr:U3 small nucleolar ribonucleoprotein protein MPP10 isoform X2 [Eutrema salsugineum]